MTFFIVTGRALKQWFFFWDIYKIPYKWAKLRAFAGFMTCSALIVWGFQFYKLEYLPYEGYKYPLLSQMNTDRGVWVFSHSKKLEYVLTSDGRKILFEHALNQYRDELMKSQGLNPLSRFDPEVHVKVWWFPRPNTKANVIGQLEIDGKLVYSYNETYQSFLRSKDHSGFYSFVKNVSIFILILFLWEFLSQYINYRQEHNVRKRSE
jgi:hypothetical protein